MKTIRIIDGVTVGITSNGIVSAKTRSDGWFDVPDNVAEKLCKAKNAEYFNAEQLETVENDGFEVFADDSEGNDKNGCESKFEAMSFEKLGDVMKELGIFDASYRSKKARIEALNTYYGNISAETEDFVV